MKKNEDTIQDVDNEETVHAEAEQVVEEASETPEEAEQEETVIDWEDKYKRALADYQNLEKRVEAQRRELILSSSRGILERLLPVLDTLMLASKHVNDKGLEVSIQQFLDVLKSEGVQRVETKHKKFDPSLMEAVGTDSGEPEKVLEEVRAGYTLHTTLLRPAQVIVGKKEDK